MLNCAAGDRKTQIGALISASCLAAVLSFMDVRLWLQAFKRQDEKHDTSGSHKPNVEFHMTMAQKQVEKFIRAVTCQAIAGQGAVRLRDFGGNFGGTGFFASA